VAKRACRKRLKRTAALYVWEESGKRLLFCKITVQTSLTSRSSTNRDTHGRHESINALNQAIQKTKKRDRLPRHHCTRT